MSALCFKGSSELLKGSVCTQTRSDVFSSVWTGMMISELG